jgi:nucleoside-diphosphate-sugar epimerase
LGGCVAGELLRQPELVHLVLLARGASQAEAEARIRKSVARFVQPSRLSDCWHRCVVLCADLRDVPALVDLPFDRITHVLHLAGDTSLRSVSGVRETNVQGTLNLATRLQRTGTLVRFLHVGTAFICGANAPSIVHEDDYPRPDVQHLVEYTRSKAQAEMLLEQMAPRLPLVVARPSIVVGHSRFGCRPSSSIFWYYRAVDLLRRVRVPLAVRKDIVPVDYVASALIHLLFRPELRYSRYHISAGETASVSWQEMATIFAHYHGAFPERPYRIVSHAELAREWGDLKRRLGPGDDGRLLQALEPFFRLSASGAEIFDNRRLLEEGFPAPPRFTHYLPICIETSSNRSLYDQLRDDY